MSALAVAGIAAALYSDHQARAAALAQLRTKRHEARERRQKTHDALYDYVLSSYGLNRSLRAGKTLDELDGRARTITTGLDDWIKSEPSQQGRYFRGVPHRAVSDWNKVQPGDTVTDKGFTSLSKKLTTAEVFAEITDQRANGPGVIIIARGKATQLPYNQIRNSYGKALDETLQNEKEFLLPRGSRMTVRRVSNVTRSRKSATGSVTFRYRLVFVDIE